jgi:hypothetical protein
LDSGRDLLNPIDQVCTQMTRVGKELQTILFCALNDLCATRDLK